LDKANGLLVDVSRALDGQSRLWATERLSIIMVIGHLERSSASVGRLLLSLPFLLLLIWILVSDASSYSSNAQQYAIVSIKQSGCPPSHPGHSYYWVRS
jgi:hypothetical protein